MFCQGWSEIRVQSDHCITVKAAPHQWLMPRCAAAIHHGGAGTTAASLRAGIPTIILPILLDQYFWADRVAAAGVGPRKTIPLRKIKPHQLVSLLKEAFDEECIGRARSGLPLRKANCTSEPYFQDAGYQNCERRWIDQSCRDY